MYDFVHDPVQTACEIEEAPVLSYNDRSRLRNRRNFDYDDRRVSQRTAGDPVATAFVHRYPRCLSFEFADFRRILPRIFAPFKKIITLKRIHPAEEIRRGVFFSKISIFLQ